MHQRPSTDRTSFIRYIPGGWGHAVLNLAESIGFARRYADALLLSAFKAWFCPGGTFVTLCYSGTGLFMQP